MVKLVGVNEKGRPVGESHHGARLSDHDVDLIFVLYDDGQGMTITEIAKKFDCRKSVVNDILKGRRRVQRAVRWKRVDGYA